jgi:hypothetical protein
MIKMSSMVELKGINREAAWYWVKEFKPWLKDISMCEMI